MKRFLICILCLVVLFTVTACSSPSSDGTNDTTAGDTTAGDTTVLDDTTAEEKPAPSFDVTVVDQNGDTVKGVTLQICYDVCLPAVSDDNGIAHFPAEVVDGHKLSVQNLPEGYSYEGEAEIYLDAGITEYTITITKAE